tara:strand:+ start:155 stop:376 length:222 start_codon:yes stop_codon:yes gene_type:complete
LLGVTPPIASIKVQLEIEAKYDPFKGRTPEQFADLIEDELHSALFDFREEEIMSIDSKVESVQLINADGKEKN